MTAFTKSQAPSLLFDLRDLWVPSASQDQGTLASTERGIKRVFPAGLWLSHTTVQPCLSRSSMLLFLEFSVSPRGGISGPPRIVSSLLVLFFLDFHPFRCASSFCSRMINRALRFLTLPSAQCPREPNTAFIPVWC